MAVTPIEIFAPQQTGLLGLFGGAQQALSTALNNSIQLGRDIANNASTQERDFLGEQRAAISFDERKGVRAQEQANTDRTYDESVRRNDRDYARRLFEDERDSGLRVAGSNRAAANDAVRLQLSLDDNARADKKLAADEAETAAAAEAAAAAKQFNRDLLKPEAEDPGLTGVPILGGLRLRDAEDSPAVRAADADLRLKAAIAEKDVEGARRAARDKALAEESDGGVAGETPAQKLSRERFDFSKEQATKTEENRKETSAVKQVAERQKVLVTDPDAFPPPTKFARQKAAALAKEGKPTDEADADYEAAQAAGKDPVAYETNAALAMGEEEYVKAVLPKNGEGKRVGDVSDAIAKKRRSFWRNAQKLSTGAAAEDETSEKAPDNESDEDPYEQFLVPK